MKKIEFPTFLNEQPTVVFGRTMRELMVILIGLGCTYAVWTNLSTMFRGAGFAIFLINILCVSIILTATVIVALVKIASRPLEEWALVSFFYYCTPKIFLYMPLHDDKSSDFEMDIHQYQRDTEDIDAE